MGNLQITEPMQVSTSSSSSSPAGIAADSAASRMTSRKSRTTSGAVPARRLGRKVTLQKHQWLQDRYASIYICIYMYIYIYMSMYRYMYICVYWGAGPLGRSSSTPGVIHFAWDCCYGVWRLQVVLLTSGPLQPLNTRHEMQGAP